MSVSRRPRSLAAALALIVVSAAPWAAPSRAVASASSQPLAAASIRLAVDGNEIASFNQLLALTSSLEQPLQGGAIRRFAVVLRRPVTASLEIAAWHHAALRGDEAARKDVVMTMHAADGSAVVRYTLSRAFPSKLELASSEVSEVLIETVTIACEHVERASLLTLPP